MCETVWIEDALLDCEQTAVGIGRVGICVALWNCANPDGKCVNEERKILKVNTNPSSNVCSVSSNVSLLLLKEFCTISLPFELEWKVCGWRFADAGVPQGSNNRPLGYPRSQRPLSAVVVTGSASLCCTNVSAQWDAICTVISWASRCCWWSWRRDKGRKVTGATVGFAGRHTELWSTHWHLHHVCMF